MGLVRSFQISAVFPHLTVLDNVRVALQRPNGLGHQFWRRPLARSTGLTPRAQELLEAVGLPTTPHALAADLSYGRKRVLEIATTLALDPQVLLLDEPMAGMGHEDVGHVSALISRRRRGPRRPDGRAQSLASSPTSATRSSCCSAARSSPQGDYDTVSQRPAACARPIWGPTDA